MPWPLLSSWDSRVQSRITDWGLHFLLWLSRCFKIDWFFCRIVLLVPFPFLLNEHFISVESEFYLDWNGTTVIKIQSLYLKPQATEIPGKPSNWLINASWGGQILCFHFCHTVSVFDLAIREARWKSKNLPVSALSACDRVPVTAASDQL